MFFYLMHLCACVAASWLTVVLFMIPIVLTRTIREDFYLDPNMTYWRVQMRSVAVAGFFVALYITIGLWSELPSIWVRYYLISILIACIATTISLMLTRKAIDLADVMIAYVITTIPPITLCYLGYKLFDQYRRSHTK